MIHAAKETRVGTECQDFMGRSCQLATPIQ